MEHVHRDPARAIELADLELDSDDVSVEDRARALWVRGMALRESDELEAAEIDLVHARDLALAIGDPALVAQIDVTRSLVVAYLGRSDEALEILELARRDLSGVERARLDAQCGLIEQRRGNLDLALDRYVRALPVLEASDDGVATARLHANLGALYVYRDDAGAAVGHCLRAVELAAANDQRLLQAGALHNLGYAQGRLGNVIDALASMAAARDLYAGLPPSPMSLALGVDHAEVLRRANLVEEARQVSQRAVDEIRAFGNETDLADALLLAARCNLAARDPEAAMGQASEALLLFAEHDRDAWLPVAELARLTAMDSGAGAVGPPIVSAQRIATRLDDLGWRSEALEASLIAIRTQIESGDVGDAVERLGELRVRSRTAAPTQRAAVSLAAALTYESINRPSNARRAITEGLRLLAENQVALGSTDLRAHAVGHAHELREVGLRLALADQRPREFLARVESSVGVTSLLARVAPSDDADLEADLGELRRVLSVQGSGDDGERLETRRRALEIAIRDRARQRRGGTGPAQLGLADAIRRLEHRSLLEYAVVDGRLWVCSVVDGRAELAEIGSVDDVVLEAESLTFAINRLQRSHGSDASRAAARDVLRTIAHELRDRLVPARVIAADGAVVVVPTDSLHGLAWPALLQTPARPLSIAPSLTGWVRARDGARRTVDRTAQIVGPDLDHANDEARRVAVTHTSTMTLAGDDARAEACRSALESADIVHFACHGRFRTDNPMFSALRVADGDLTVYDLERCRRLPSVIVMSSCDAGRNAVTSGGALIGLASALGQLGVSSVIAPLTPVNDEGSVPLMVELHRRLAAGDEPAAALANAAALRDGSLDPMAAPFVCFGA